MEYTFKLQKKKMKNLIQNRSFARKLLNLINPSIIAGSGLYRLRAPGLYDASRVHPDRVDTPRSAHADHKERKECGGPGAICCYLKLNESRQVRNENIQTCICSQEISFCKCRQFFFFTFCMNLYFNAIYADQNQTNCA